MKHIDYEYESKKDTAKETIMYGVIWIFISLMISGIPYLQKENNLLYNAISVFLFVIGIRKLVIGITRLKRIKKPHKIIVP